MTFSAFGATGGRARDGVCGAPFVDRRKGRRFLPLCRHQQLVCAHICAGWVNSAGLVSGLNKVSWQLCRYIP